MADPELAHLIRRTGAAMRRAASDLRKSPEAAALAQHLCSGPPPDADDLRMLAALISGHLNRGDGERRASYSHGVKRDAETKARQWQAKNGGALKAACEAVAPGFPGLDATALFNYVRRGARAK